MLAGSVFGVALAGVGAAYLSDAQVRLAVGAIGIVFVLYNWLARVPTAAPARCRGKLVAIASAERCRRRQRFGGELPASQRTSFIQ